MSEIRRPTEVSKRSFTSVDSQESVVASEVESALSGLRHGKITIVVRQGRVVEIERVSRNRLEAAG